MGQRFKHNNNKELLTCKKGDLLRVVDETINDLPNDCVYALNLSTNEKGIVPKNQLHIIPCIDEPPQSLLNEMRKQTDLKSEESVETIQQVVPIYNNCTLDLVRLPIAHTLQKFAADNFRSNDSPRELWRHSPEPLRRPLLKQTENRVEVLESYFGIMRFMNDVPMMEMCHAVELTNQIFSSPIKYTDLRDELYCQLMKQLTDNPSPMSEQKGFKLLWLACGLFCNFSSKNLILIPGF